MYMMRLVYHCKRGKAPEVVECLQTLNQRYGMDLLRQHRQRFDHTRT